MMLKSKQRGSDWSSTGTFLRKPAGGWIHDDSEFQSGLSINYTVQYLGSVIVNTSMRTLQFNVRTQVTKEAILRLAEQSGNIFLGKRRKTPKQVERLLGGTDVRWAGEVNLSISVESLKISDEVGGMVILNHSLPSISFASGGDGATTDYIGYVAKDPVHGRACHVFECPLSSHFVLATIGQAFELRYKMYLSGPTSQPPTRQNGRDTWDDRDRGASTGDRSNEHGILQTLAEVHEAHRSNSTSPPNNDQSGIYSDVQDLPPPDSVPPPVPSARYTLSDNNDIPPLPNRKKGQELPALPNEKNRPTTSTAASIRRLDNPYDTMEFSTNVGAAGASRVPGATATRVIASSGTYEEIDKAMKGSSSAQNGPIVTVRPRPKRPAYDDTQVEEYSDTFISIRQSIVNNEEDEIDLTPSLSPPQHDYTNVALPEEQESGKLVAMKQKHPKPPKPPPFNAHQSSSNAASSRVTSTHSPQQNNNPHISPALSRRNNGSGSPKPPARTGDSPKPPARFSESPKPPGRSGDSPKNPARSSDFPKPPARSSESSSPKPTRKVGPEATTPPLVRQSYDNPYQLKAKPPVKAKPSVPLAKTRPGSYDDPEEVIRYKDKKKPKKPSREGLGVLASSNDGNNFDYDDPDEGMYNTAEAVYDDTGVNVAEVAASPKFDDGIYMSGGGIPKNRHPPAASAATSPPDPLGPLKKQNYFHGFLSRPEAEGLLVEDGEYLIRESSKKPGQYVLTGMANGKIQHLLLMDKQGRVKSKDREFDSVQHLIQYFIQSQLPLVIGNSQVFLKKPVVNAFSSA